MSAATKGTGAKAPVLFPKGDYRCPECDKRVQVFVKLSALPECGSHSGGSVKMEVVK